MAPDTLPAPFGYLVNHRYVKTEQGAKNAAWACSVIPGESLPITAIWTESALHAYARSCIAAALADVPGVEGLASLAGDYFACGYAEGQEGRTHDTIDGKAADALQAIKMWGGALIADRDAQKARADKAEAQNYEIAKSLGAHIEMLNSALAAVISTWEAAEAKVASLGARLTAITIWLEANQRDVWRRGIWDAINAADKALKDKP